MVAVSSMHDKASVTTSFETLHEFVAPARRNLSRGDLGLPDGRRRDRDHATSATAWPSIRSPSGRACCATSRRSDTGGKLLGQQAAPARHPGADRLAAGHRRRRAALAPTGPRRASAPAHAELGLRAGPGGRRRRQRHPKMFQLYVRGDAAWVDDYIAARDCQRYVALCLTVDLDYYGRRERDIAKRYMTTARRRSHPADISGPLLLGRRRPASRASSDPLHPQGHRHGARTPRSPSSTASKASTSPTTAAASSTTARAAWPCCRRSSMPWPAAPQIIVDGGFMRGSRHRQGHGAGRQRRRHRPPAGPGARRRRGVAAWCACSSCWRTRRRAAWACSA